jgi:hypothetical protein
VTKRRIELKTYLIDEDTFAKLKSVEKALYGNGTAMNADGRRDLANAMNSVMREVECSESEVEDPPQRVAVKAQAAGDLAQAAKSQVQVSECGNTVWVHHLSDGSTVGRFSKFFGMDVHRTVAEQLSGEPQCLRCTHVKPNHNDWLEFCELMRVHHSIEVDSASMLFDK